MKTLLLPVLALVLTFVSARAASINIGAENITLDLPEGWTQLDSPSPALAAAHGGPNMMQLLKFPNARNVVIEPGIVAQVKTQMSQKISEHGGEVSFGDEDVLTMGGAPAYVINFTQTATNGTVSGRLYLIDANHGIYALYLLTNGAALDPQAQAVADSFRFTVPPTLPESTLVRRAYKLGLLVGVLLVFGAIGAGIWFIVRRRDA